MQLGAAALVDVAVLWAVVLATLVAFWRARPLAGRLFVPCLIWLSFAAELDLALWRLNPQIL